MLGLFVHALEWIKRSLEVTFEGVTGLLHFILNFVPLLLGDARSQGVALKVAAHTDTSGDDHGCLVWRERWARELAGVHVRDVLVIRLVAMVVLDDLIHQGCEGLVRVM